MHEDISQQVQVDEWAGGHPPNWVGVPQRRLAASWAGAAALKHCTVVCRADAAGMHAKGTRHLLGTCTHRSHSRQAARWLPAGCRESRAAKRRAAPRALRHASSLPKIHLEVCRSGNEYAGSSKNIRLLSWALPRLALATGGRLAAACRSRHPRAQTPEQVRARGYLPANCKPALGPTNQLWQDAFLPAPHPLLEGAERAGGASRQTWRVCPSADLPQSVEVQQLAARWAGAASCTNLLRHRHPKKLHCDVPGARTCMPVRRIGCLLGARTRRSHSRQAASWLPAGCPESRAPKRRDAPRPLRHAISLPNI